MQLTAAEKKVLLFIAAILIIGLAAGILRARIIESTIYRRSVHEVLHPVTTINTATKEQISALRGIGPVIAGRIVEYRTLNGPFILKEDLLKVKGIGPKKLRAIRDSVSLE